MVESPTPADVRAMLSTSSREDRPGASASLARDAGRLDAAAGCEFVDDRVRTRE
jgi:hypothetical protein